MLEIKSGELKGAPITEGLIGGESGDFAAFVDSQLESAEADLFEAELEDLKPTSFMHSMSQDIAEKLGMTRSQADLNPVAPMLSNISEYLFDLGARDTKSCITLFCQMLSVAGARGNEPLNLIESVDRYIRKTRELRAIQQTNKAHSLRSRDVY